jgi:hypothetical protein
LTTSLIEWVNPRDVTLKLPEQAVLRLLTQRKWPFLAEFDAVPYEETAKFISVQARITRDIPWEETPIFELYRERIETGESVKGHRELQSLAEAYEQKYSAIVRALSTEGFSRKKLRELRPRELPWAFRSRSGSLWFGNQGNHRLAIAKVIGLEAFPVFGRFHHCNNLHSDCGDWLTSS